jgi:hypothetical protein
MNLENWTDLQLLVLGLLDVEDDVQHADDEEHGGWISDCAMLINLRRRLTGV